MALVSKATGYSPQAKGSPQYKMEGGYWGSRGAYLSTLDDYRTGAASYVSLAANPIYHGQQYTIKEITYRSALDGQTYTLTDVPAKVEDTGSAFDGSNPSRWGPAAWEGRFDIALGRDYPSSLSNQPISAEFEKGWVSRDWSTENMYDGTQSFDQTTAASYADSSAAAALNMPETEQWSTTNMYDGTQKLDDTTAKAYAESDAAKSIDTSYDKAKSGTYSTDPKSRNLVEATDRQTKQQAESGNVVAAATTASGTAIATTAAKNTAATLASATNWITSLMAWGSDVFVRGVLVVLALVLIGSALWMLGKHAAPTIKAA